MNAELKKQDIDDFIALFNDYKQRQQSQKMRGLNDFNLFTTLLKADNEVRLHSQFLRFLLDPNANHYQGDLFLRLFLSKCKLNDFELDTQNCSVYKEYENIDLYLTDGTRHIIIENKIWASDQHRQIKRYIEIIKNENKDSDLNKNLVVMYLSLGRAEPCNYSLDDFKIEGNYLVNQNDEKYQFKSIHYNNQIKKWLKESHKQIANITNLSIGIRQYQEVIQKIYGKYRGKVMNLDEYLKDKENKVELIKNMKEISTEYQRYRLETIGNFWDKSIERSKKKWQIEEGWEIVEVRNELRKGKSRHIPLQIRQSEKAKVVFGFEFDRDDFTDPIFGIVKNNAKVDLSNLNEHDEIKKLFGQEKSFQWKLSDWWLKNIEYCKGDLFDEIIENGGSEDAATEFVKKFITLFDKYKEKVTKCNEILAKKNEK